MEHIKDPALRQFIGDITYPLVRLYPKGEHEEEVVIEYEGTPGDRSEFMEWLMENSSALHGEVENHTNESVKDELW